MDTFGQSAKILFHSANTQNFREQYVGVIVVIVETLYYLEKDLERIFY